MCITNVAVKKFYLMIIGKRLAKKILLGAKQRRKSHFLEISLSILDIPCQY